MESRNSSERSSTGLRISPARRFPEEKRVLVDELDVRLNDAVKAHLVADVPVGVFLSGGVDSSLVAAIAQRHSGEPLRTLTIGFAGGDDERHFARTVAAHMQSQSPRTSRHTGVGGSASSSALVPGTAAL